MSEDRVPLVELGRGGRGEAVFNNGNNSGKRVGRK